MLRYSDHPTFYLIYAASTSSSSSSFSFGCSCQETLLRVIRHHPFLILHLFLSCHTNNPNIHTHYIHKPLWPYNATCPLFLLPQNTPLSSPSSSTVSTSTLLVDIIGGVIPGQFNMKIYFLMICMFYLAKTLCQMHFVTQLYSFILAWNQH